jgi:ATP-dependent Lon protease
MSNHVHLLASAKDVIFPTFFATLKVYIAANHRAIQAAEQESRKDWMHASLAMQEKPHQETVLSNSGGRQPAKGML